MQIIEIYLEPGEGEAGARILTELGVKDFNLVKSESGDSIIVRKPLDKTDDIITKFNEEFRFDNDNRRGMILSTPDVVLPRGAEKEKSLSEKSAWETMLEYGEQNSIVDSKYIALFLFSAIVATLGLITDNVAVVVGAMIIAPAFGPIAASAIGIVSGRTDLFNKGMRTEVIGVGLAVLVAAAIGFILPGVEMNELLRSRMYPTIFDLFVALAAGAAGGYVLVSGKGSSVVGVMVAAALIPVMASIGIGFVFLNPLLVLGALLLLIVNVVSISLAMVLVFWFAGPKQENLQTAYAQKTAGKPDVEDMVEGMRMSYKNRVRKSTIQRMVKYSIVLIILLAIPLMWLTYENILTKNPTKEITDAFVQNNYENLELGGIIIEGKNIYVTIYDFHSVDSSVFDDLYNGIKDNIDPRYTIEFNIVKAEKKRY